MVTKTATSAVASVVNSTPDALSATLTVKYVKADGSLFADNAAPTELIESEATTLPSMSAAGAWRTGYRAADGTPVYTTGSHSDKAFAVLFTVSIAAEAGTLDEVTSYSIKLSLGSDISSNYAAIAYKFGDSAKTNFDSASEKTIKNDIKQSASAQTFKLWVWIDGLQTGVDGANATFAGSEGSLFTCTFSQNAAA